MDGRETVEPAPAASAEGGSRPTTQGSSHEAPSGRAGTALAGLAALGGALLLATLPLALVHVEIDGRRVASYGTDTAHDVAFCLLGLGVLAAAWAASRRTGPIAWAALALLGLTAVIVVAAFDLPDVRDSGAFGRSLELAQSVPGPAFYLESLGATLALVAGGLGLLLRLDAPG